MQVNGINRQPLFGGLSSQVQQKLDVFLQVKYYGEFLEKLVRQMEECLENKSFETPSQVLFNINNLVTGAKAEHSKFTQNDQPTDDQDSVAARRANVLEEKLQTDNLDQFLKNKINQFVQTLDPKEAQNQLVYIRDVDVDLDPLLEQALVERVASCLTTEQQQLYQALLKQNAGL